MDKIVLIRDAAIHDPNAGGMWTVRRCVYLKAPNPADGQMQHLYELRCENPNIEPILIKVAKSEDLDVRAEFLSIIPTSN